MGRLLDEDAVIKILERWQKAFKENSHYVSASDLSLVIKDVRELPTIQSVATDTNVGDTISRQAAIDALDVGAEYFRRVLDLTDIAGVDRENCKWVMGLIEAQISDIKELPPAQPERPKGE